MLKLILSIIISHSAGIIGSLFTRQAVPSWYAQLVKPTFAPPNWLFSPVWITLYTLMGIAAWLVWRKGLNAPGVKGALAIFLLQLILNALWPIVFFGARSITGGLLVIVLLWLAISLTMKAFGGISRLAFFLLIPYILWVSYALVLNAAILILNR